MEYDRYASAIRAEYESFTNALVADYLSHTSAGRGVEAAGLLRASGLALVARFMRRATILTNDYLTQEGGGTLRDAREHPYLNALRAIAIKNLNDLIVRLMSGGNRLADVLNRNAGAVGLLIQKKLAKPELLATDRSGRKWQADKLVAVMAREFAYQHYLDAAIAQFKAEGVQVVQVVYPDPNHAHHGTTLRLDAIATVRKTLFHPNSQARLVPYVST